MKQNQYTSVMPQLGNLDKSPCSRHESLEETDPIQRFRLLENNYPEVADALKRSRSQEPVLVIPPDGFPTPTPYSDMLLRISRRESMWIDNREIHIN